MQFPAPPKQPERPGNRLPMNRVEHNEEILFGAEVVTPAQELSKEIQAHRHAHNIDISVTPGPKSPHEPSDQEATHKPHVRDDSQAKRLGIFSAKQFEISSKYVLE